MSNVKWTHGANTCKTCNGILRVPHPTPPPKSNFDTYAACQTFSTAGAPLLLEVKTEVLSSFSFRLFRLGQHEALPGGLAWRDFARECSVLFYDSSAARSLTNPASYAGYWRVGCCPRQSGGNRAQATRYAILEGMSRDSKLNICVIVRWNRVIWT